MPWLNHIRLVEGNHMSPESIAETFTCDCAPGSRAHERMVTGALRNMSPNYYLEDGLSSAARLNGEENGDHA